MPSNSNIILTGADGVVIHLAGNKTPFTGGGTPWTSRATSPYQLSMNDATGGIWTPVAPTPLDIYGSGAPYSIGAPLLYQGFDNVQEEMGIHMYATSHNHAVTLLRVLRRVLSTSLTSRPPVLSVQPDGSTNTVYYEITSAVVQESPTFINQEAGAPTKVIRALIRWTRSPFGGRVSSGETILNNVTIGNSPTATPSNLASLGTSGNGDMVNAGQPMNLLIGSTGSDRDVFLATVASRGSVAPGAVLSAGTTVTTTATPTAMVGSEGLTLRVLARITNASSNLELRAEVNGASGPWVPASISSGVTVLLDLGGFSLPYLRTLRSGLTPSITVQLRARSSNGSAVTGTLATVETLAYYTFCQYFDPDNTTRITTYLEQTGRPAIPISTEAYAEGAGVLLGPVPVIGRPPVYISGASLWIAWRTNGSNVIVESATTTITATQAPLYHTLRGNG